MTLGTDRILHAFPQRAAGRAARAIGVGILTGGWEGTKEQRKVQTRSSLFSAKTAHATNVTLPGEDAR